MIDLLIIGAGNVGGYLSYNIEMFGEYNILGFLDDDKEKINKIIYDRKVLGAIKDISHFALHTNLHVAIGIASPEVKRKVRQSLSNSNFIFPNFIAPNVWLSNSVQVGKGVILYPGVSINYESVIGDFVIMNMNCAIGHNCTISKFSSLAPSVNLAGFTYLEECVDMGIGVSTKQNVRIGNGAIIGGQSMLVENVQPFSKVVGVPGKQIK